MLFSASLELEREQEILTERGIRFQRRTDEGLKELRCCVAPYLSDGLQSRNSDKDNSLVLSLKNQGTLVEV